MLLYSLATFLFFLILPTLAIWPKYGTHEPHPCFLLSLLLGTFSSRSPPIPPTFSQSADPSPTTVSPLSSHPFTSYSLSYLLSSPLNYPNFSDLPHRFTSPINSQPPPIPTLFPCANHLTIYHLSSYSRFCIDLIGIVSLLRFSGEVGEEVLLSIANGVLSVKVIFYFRGGGLKGFSKVINSKNTVLSIL